MIATVIAMTERMNSSLLRDEGKTPQSAQNDPPGAMIEALERQVASPNLRPTPRKLVYISIKVAIWFISVV